MLTILSIVVGLLFVILLMSILASTVHDVLDSMLSLKAKNLHATLKNMLGNHAGEFFQHPFFEQLNFADHQKRAGQPYAMPGKVSKETFSAVLHDMLSQRETPGGSNLADKIAHLDDPKLLWVLEYLARQSDGTEGGFKQKTELWFDEMMGRSSGWFARATRWRLLAIGLVLAFALNADTISIYKHLSANAALRDELVGAAEQLAKRDSLPTVKGSTIEETLKNIEKFYSGNIKPISSPLGLGWNDDRSQQSIPDWLTKMFGLLLMGIAVTFGAAFWFDLLKKVLAVRSNLTGKDGGAGEKNAGPDSPSDGAQKADRGKNAHPNDEKPIGTPAAKARPAPEPARETHIDDGADEAFLKKDNPATPPPGPEKKGDRSKRRPAAG